MNKKGIYFEINGKDCIKIALNSANLPVALATNTVDVTRRKKISSLFMCHRCVKYGFTCKS